MIDSARILNPDKDLILMVYERREGSSAHCFIQKREGRPFWAGIGAEIKWCGGASYGNFWGKRIFQAEGTATEKVLSLALANLLMMVDHYFQTAQHSKKK